MNAVVNTLAATDSLGFGGVDEAFLNSSAAGTGTVISPAVPFAGVFQTMLQQTSALDQKANMAFELALQIRNKAVGAYQQMMSMQF